MKTRQASNTRRRNEKKLSQSGTNPRSRGLHHRRARGDLVLAATGQFSLRGTVLQKVKPQGMLVECSEGRIARNEDQTDGFQLDSVRGLVFLVGHQLEKDFVDDEAVGVIAVRIGNYEYTTALGATKTVAAYKFVRPAAIADMTQAQMQALKRQLEAQQAQDAQDAAKAKVGHWVPQGTALDRKPGR